MEALLALIALFYGVGLPVGVFYLLAKVGRIRRDNSDLAARLTQAEKTLGMMSRRSSDDPSVSRPDMRDLVQDVSPETSTGPVGQPSSDVSKASAPSDPWGKSAAEPPTRENRSEPAKERAPVKAKTVVSAPAIRKPAAPTAFDRVMGDLGRWLTQNWVYAVAAVSLALAGIFLVQYGIENGLLPPTARVLAALGFGAVMVGAGEYLRKRWGDGEDSPVAFLPSVFSGAGIVTLFGAVLSARHLYDLIGPTTCFSALLAVAFGAIVLGWLTGPLLSALGVVGAFVTPFLLGGDSDASPVMAYLGIVTLVGLTIDTYRRWHWLSVLSVGMGYALSVLLVAAAKVDPEWIIGFALILPFAAIVVMGWRLVPHLPGAALLPSLIARAPLQKLPRRAALIHAMMAGSTGWLLVASGYDNAEFWLSVLALVVLSGGMMFWARHSAALEDVPVFPALGLIGLIWLEQGRWGQVYRTFSAALPDGISTEMRWSVIVLVALGALIGLLAAWRSLTGARHPRVWAFVAAIFAPTILVSLEVVWAPTRIIGAFHWALTALALAGLMVLKLERFVRANDVDKMRLSLVLIAALGLISFALTILLSDAALTVALALTVLSAAALDRRYDLPLLVWFVVIGTILVSGRLVIHPGLIWAGTAPLLQLCFAYVGAILPLAAAWQMAKQRDRIKAIVTLESAVVSLLAILAALLLERAIDAMTVSYGSYHWRSGLNALIWLVAAGVQAWRLQLGGRLAWLRMGLAGIYAVLAVGYLASALLRDNPFMMTNEVVHGWPGISTLTVAYVLPAILLLVAAKVMTHLPKRLRLGVMGSGGGLLLFWIVAEIAHFWRGPVLPSQPMRQPELYTYTVALLILGAGLLYQAIARQSDLLRRVAMGVIALTVAKVFLVDISGLDGLMRVFSFLALGLSLAGLAWLNRWAAMQARDGASNGGDTESTL